MSQRKFAVFNYNLRWKLLLIKKQAPYELIWYIKFTKTI